MFSTVWALAAEGIKGLEDVKLCNKWITNNIFNFLFLTLPPGFLMATVNHSLSVTLNQQRHFTTPLHIHQIKNCRGWTISIYMNTNEMVKARDWMQGCRMKVVWQILSMEWKVLTRLHRGKLQSKNANICVKEKAKQRRKGETSSAEIPTVPHWNDIYDE